MGSGGYGREGERLGLLEIEAGTWNTDYSRERRIDHHYWKEQLVS